MVALSDVQTAVIQVTNACPFNCEQCYTKKGETFLPVEIAERVLDKAFRNRRGLLQITGGEPLLYPELDELISFCERRSILSAIATSGYALSRERAATLKIAGLNYLFVSLNGSKKEIHEKTRNDFACAMAAIRNAKEAGLLCMVNFVAGKSNADDLTNVIELCKQEGASALFLLKRHPNFSGENEEFPAPEQLRRMKEQIDAEKDLEIIVETCFKELLPQPMPCGAGDEFFYLDCYGKFSFCSKAVKKYDSFEEMQTKKNEWEEARTRCGGKEGVC